MDVTKWLDEVVIKMDPATAHDLLKQMPHIGYGVGTTYEQFFAKLWVAVYPLADE